MFGNLFADLSGMKRKTMLSIFSVSILLLLLIFFFQTSLYHIHPSARCDYDTEKKLLSVAASALITSDVPVGAVILYNDTILSTGFNTVLRDSSAGEHAEINAISNAIRKIGFENFSKLNRDKLILISTFEPCMMCRGAIIEYNIRHVAFMKGKGILHWMKNDARQLLYEWNKQQSEGAEKQDSLFRMHPNYRERN